MRPAHHGPNTLPTQAQGRPVHHRLSALLCRTLVLARIDAPTELLPNWVRLGDRSRDIAGTLNQSSPQMPHMPHDQELLNVMMPSCHAECAGKLRRMRRGDR